MNKELSLKGVLLSFVLIALIGIMPLLMINDSEFGGADGQAMDLVLEIDATYEPWMESIWAPPGGETESLLFCLQAALGSGVFFYIIGYFVGSKQVTDAQKNKKKKKG